MAERWTVDAGPRVYHLAIHVGLPSRRVLADLQDILGYEGKSSSSRVPLPMALEFASWWRSDARHYKLLG